MCAHKIACMDKILHLTDRDNDFRRVYFKIISRLPNEKRKYPYPYLYAIKSRAERFYVSEKQAYEAITLLESGKLNYKGIKYNMYSEIYKRVQKILLLKRCSKIQAVREVIYYQSAPEFYISLRTAERIISKHELRSNNIRKYRSLEKV